MKKIKDEFVTYDLALRLKALGFDEPCLTKYNKTVKGVMLEITNIYTTVNPANINAPTWQSAFKFFEEKYSLCFLYEIVNFGADEFTFSIYDLYEEKTLYNEFVGAGASGMETFNTSKENKIAGLTRLCEIVEKQKKVKSRSIKELLQVMLDNKNLFEYSLCYWSDHLLDKLIISKEESIILKQYILDNRPSKWSSWSAYINRNSNYYWKHGKIKYRTKWLNEQIKKL